MNDNNSLLDRPPTPSIPFDKFLHPDEEAIKRSKYSSTALISYIGQTKMEKSSQKFHT